MTRWMTRWTIEGPSPWTHLPEWLLRTLADCAPSRAAEVGAATFGLRGVPYVPHVGGDIAMETMCRWLRSGSRVLTIQEDPVLAALEQLGPTPRFHALSTPAPGVMIRIPFNKLVPPGQAYHRRQFEAYFYVEPTAQGPWLSGFVKWIPEDPWQVLEEPSGVYDLLSHETYLQQIRILEPSTQLIHKGMYAIAVIAMHAAAAIVETREIVQRRPRPKRKKGGRGSRQRRRPRTQVYTLDPHALSAWTQRTVRETAPQGSQGSRGPSTRVVRLHTCKEHYRRVWVASPAPTDTVVDSKLGRVRKDGTRRKLFAVKRRILPHARGRGVVPAPIVLRSPA